MLINAHLKGHEFDLLTLAELFREGDPAVAGDHEGYYLSFTAPDELPDDGAQLYDAASVLCAESTVWPGHSAVTFGRWP
jgi:hypothetical protein